MFSLHRLDSSPGTPAPAHALKKTCKLGETLNAAVGGNVGVLVKMSTLSWK